MISATLVHVIDYHFRLTKIWLYWFKILHIFSFDGFQRGNFLLNLFSNSTEKLFSIPIKIIP